MIRDANRDRFNKRVFTQDLTTRTDFTGVTNDDLIARLLGAKEQVVDLMKKLAEATTENAALRRELKDVKEKPQQDNQQVVALTQKLQSTKAKLSKALADINVLCAEKHCFEIEAVRLEGMLSAYKSSRPDLRSPPPATPLSQQQQAAAPGMSPHQMGVDAVFGQF